MSASVRIDRDRLVEWAGRAIGVPSFTGDEQAMAELMRETFLEMGLKVQWQQVEDGRANVLGIREGSGDDAGQAQPILLTIESRGEADDFRVDRRTAALRVLPLLEDKDAGSFRQDVAIAIAVKRAGGMGGIVVADRER